VHEEDVLAHMWSSLMFC